MIEKEIPQKGKCYVVCTLYDAADFDVSLAAACDMAAAKGARTLYFAMRDQHRRLDGAVHTLGGRTFRYDTRFVILKKDLTGALADAQPLRTKPLRAGNAALFCAIYNESFFDVPNSQTMDDAEMQAIRSDAKRDAGFCMLGGDPVGVFILDYRGNVPEIAALAVRPEYRRRGYGRRALHILEAQLKSEGHEGVILLVAERNTAALALYRACNYRCEQEISRWYRTEL